MMWQIASEREPHSLSTISNLAVNEWLKCCASVGLQMEVAWQQYTCLQFNYPKVNRAKKTTDTR